MIIPPLLPQKKAKMPPKQPNGSQADKFQTITEQTLSELLGFAGLEISHFYLERQEGKQYVHLLCHHQYDVAVCPRCQQAAQGG